jgi:hypothetical protein
MLFLVADEAEKQILFVAMIESSQPTCMVHEFLFVFLPPPIR